MAPDNLTVKQKKLFCDHKASIEEDGRKFPYKDAVAYCKEKFYKIPSSSQLSRVWTARAQWFNVPDGSRQTRIRGAALPELEAALLMWLLQVDGWIVIVYGWCRIGTG